MGSGLGRIAEQLLCVTFILIASCANYKDAGSPGYAHSI